jgi:LysM repeat protein
MLLQVQPGDYVSRVAERFELRAEELLLLNADRIPQLGGYLPTGQQLLVCGIMNGEAGSGYVVVYATAAADMVVQGFVLHASDDVPAQLCLLQELLRPASADTAKQASV